MIAQIGVRLGTRKEKTKARLKKLEYKIKIKQLIPIEKYPKSLKILLMRWVKNRFKKQLEQIENKNNNFE